MPATEWNVQAVGSRGWKRGSWKGWMLVAVALAGRMPAAKAEMNPPSASVTDSQGTESPRGEGASAPAPQTLIETDSVSAATQSPSEPAAAAESAESAGQEPNIPAAASEPAEAAEEGQRHTVNRAFLTHSDAMTAIHNQYRVQMGLDAQAVDPNLSVVAQRWAEQMAASCSLYHGGGEQIIAYSGGDRSYDAGFRTWLGSSPHRAWLCSRGDRCGFGYAVGRNGCAYYAGAFGSSASVGVATTVSTSNYYTSSSYNSGRRRGFRRR
jgi:uncharacterized protein YkwD